MTKQPTTISFINQKGGCGKSSSCFHLAGTLAHQGFRVLLLDADPQGSLSQAFFGSAAIERLATHESLAALFEARCPLPIPASLVTSTPFANIDIVRANQTLAIWNSPLTDIRDTNEFALRDFIDELPRGCDVPFDFILIDCPPNIYQCSWSALLASDFVIIPVPPEDFGTQGLRIVHQAIDEARRLNSQLGLLGQLVTRSDGRLLVHRAYETKLRELYGDIVFETVVPEASAFKVSLACRRPVVFHDPTSKATASMQRLTQEMLGRIDFVQQRGGTKRPLASITGGV